MFDPKTHKLTRAGAEQAIREGGSVRVGNKLVTRLEDIPPESEFAVGDADATKKALEGLEAQRAHLDEQEKKLLAENARIEQARKEALEREKLQGKRAHSQGQPAGDEDDDDSPLSDSNVDEAIESISRMRSRERLQHVVDNDSRVSVKNAARKRLESL
jgi:hypothetical protein